MVNSSSRGKGGGNSPGHREARQMRAGRVNRLGREVGQQPRGRENRRNKQEWIGRETASPEGQRDTKPV